MENLDNLYQWLSDEGVFLFDKPLSNAEFTYDHESTPYKRFFSVCTTDEDFVIVSLDIPLSSPFDYSS